MQWNLLKLIVLCKCINFVTYILFNARMQIYKQFTQGHSIQSNQQSAHET